MFSGQSGRWHRSVFPSYLRVTWELKLYQSWLVQSDRMHLSTMENSNAWKQVIMHFTSMTDFNVGRGQFKISHYEKRNKTQRCSNTWLTKKVNIHCLHSCACIKCMKCLPCFEWELLSSLLVLNRFSGLHHSIRIIFCWRKKKKDLIYRAALKTEYLPHNIIYSYTI